MVKLIKILRLILASLLIGFLLNVVLLISYKEYFKLDYRLEKLLCEMNKFDFAYFKINCREIIYNAEENQSLDLFNLANEYMASNNVLKAESLYQKSFELGNAKSGFMLGFIYKGGLSGKYDYKKSLEYFKAAGNLGHVASTAIAANMIENGIGYQDTKEALDLYLDAGFKGNFFAQNRLIELYQLGINTPENIDEAVFWKKILEKNKLYIKDSYQLDERYWFTAIVFSDPARAEYLSIIKK